MLSISLVWVRLLSTLADISQTSGKVGLMEVGLMEAYFVLQQPRISFVFIYVFPLLRLHDMAEKPKNKSKQTAD